MSQEFITYLYFNDNIQKIQETQSGSKIHSYITYSVILGQMRSFTSWKQLYFFDWLANIGGLFTSVMGIARFVIAGYQNFVAQKSMLKRLYAEEVQTQQAVNSGIQSKDSVA